MADVTVIYYTSNREDPAFEAKVIEQLRVAAGDLPIVSCSQKPLDLGRNICVGDIGVSYVNLERQMRACAQAATTEWVAEGQADCLLAEDHFAFEPDGEFNVYAHTNAWLLRNFDPCRFAHRGKVEGLTFARREWLIERLNGALEMFPGWGPTPRRAVGYWKWHECGDFGSLPSIVCKTGNGIGKTTSHDGQFAEELPYWGDACSLSERIGLWERP